MHGKWKEHCGIDASWYGTRSDWKTAVGESYYIVSIAAGEDAFSRVVSDLDNGVHVVLDRDVEGG